MTLTVLCMGAGSKGMVDVSASCADSFLLSMAVLELH